MLTVSAKYSASLDTMKRFAIIVAFFFLFRHKTVDGKCNVTVSGTWCNSVDIPEELLNSSKLIAVIGATEEVILPPFSNVIAPLEEFSFWNFRIRQIPENSFVNMTVAYLGLRYLGIEKISPGAFKNIKNLTLLDVSYNKLKVIQAGIFTKLPVNVLDLSGNLITTIEDSALVALPNLRSLRLYRNKIENLFLYRVIDNPATLEMLHLNNNSLRILTNDMLKGLTNLKALDVACNNINTIEVGTFKNTPNLESLSLTGNKVRELDARIFPKFGMQKLQNLYLDYNELMFLNFNFFSRVIFLKRITLAGNPWLCPCLHDISRILRQAQIQEQCKSDYSKGKQLVCVNELFENNCSFKYNSDLSDKYIQNKSNIVEDGARQLPCYFNDMYFIASKLLKIY